MHVCVFAGRSIINGTWVVSTFWLLEITLLSTFAHMYLFSIRLGIHPGAELLGPMGILHLTLLGAAKLVESK